MSKREKAIKSTADKVFGALIVAFFIWLAFLGSRQSFRVYQKNHPGATFLDMMFDPEVKQ